MINYTVQELNIIYRHRYNEPKSQEFIQPHIFLYFDIINILTKTIFFQWDIESIPKALSHSNDIIRITCNVENIQLFSIYILTFYFIHPPPCEVGRVDDVRQNIKINDINIDIIYTYCIVSDQYKLIIFFNIRYIFTHHLFMPLQ